jgi:predicted ArsR family transcriptional regulator
MADAGYQGIPPDPMALRALTHPLRWKLIDLLLSETTATVTRCAEVLGESTASCSYHLGMLAKYGYIELVPGQLGREKPWQLVSRDLNLTPPGLDEEGALASEAAAEALLDHEVARLKDRLRRRGLEPEQWQRATEVMGVSAWVTAPELRDIADQVQQVLNMYSDRGEHPDRRPEGAREARLFAAITVTRPLPPRREA